jgi:bifunctional non-homologous end joining protein LigD
MGATATRKKKGAGKIKLPGAIKAPFPRKVMPMLATLTDKPFDEPGWLFEIKWDGYRALAFCNKDRVELLSRNQKSFNEKFYPIYEAVRQWGIHAVVDGEIAALTKKGAATFSGLQNWRSEADGDLYYYVFDILWLNGYDLTGLPLLQRREILRQHLPQQEGLIRMSESFDTTAAELLNAAAAMGLEGIIAKKADSIYHPGDRTRDWLKIKSNKRHEVVIGGYTRNEGSSKTFSSLLVGVFENGKLEYTGKIGTGFSDTLQKELLAKFKPLVVKKCPFTTVPDINKPSRFRPNPPKATATWLKPKLVCEVSYAEITEDGVMRHPSFEGMREDKKAKEVNRETAAPVEELVKPVKRKATKSKAAKRLLTPGKKQERKTLLNPKEDTQVRNISGHELKFTNLSKIYWPKEKYTKRDMLNYYYQVAPYILPYLKDRPQSLNRFPHGIKGKSFYQKDITGKAPDWVKTFPYRTREDNEDKNFLVPVDEASVLYMANLGCIEMNPWNSTIHQPDHPDWCALDLDPDKTNTFEQVIQTAQVVKQVLDGLKVTGYCKTSGSTGIHIYIPLNAKYTYDECQLFGKLIATQVHQQLPSFTSIERLTRNRKGKLYIDYLQNRPKATLAAAYSLRPKPGATVSMPLYWEEVKKGLQLKDFTIANAVARIKREGDIFKPVLGKGINLLQVMKKMEA